MADIRAPLHLRLTELAVDPPVAVECPFCYAIVREARFDDHKLASHA